MRVELLTGSTSVTEQIHNAALATLTCTGIESKLNEEAKNPDAGRLMLGGRRPMSPQKYDCVGLLKRRIKDGHESVIEHINLSFRVEDISRALLQELARHRHISLSVYSTRWTLSKSLKVDPANAEAGGLSHIIEDKILNLFGKEPFNIVPLSVQKELMSHYNRIIEIVHDMHNTSKVPVDYLKHLLPEITPTRLVLSCNLRELRHIFYLRSSPRALWEFRDLCEAIKASLPEELKELLLVGGPDEHES